MFGGYGVYRQGIMFALVAGDTLYLKTDAQNAPAFRERGLSPFTYERKSKMMETSYYAAPETVMEEAAEASHWGRSALEAALRVSAGRLKGRK
jgi:DNA transformation protein